MSSVTQTRFSLLERARLVRFADVQDEQWPGAVALCQTMFDVTGELVTPDSVQWTTNPTARHPRPVPYIVIDGLTFSVFSEQPPGLYLQVGCAECGGPTRVIVHNPMEVAVAVDQTRHYCADCQRERARREGRPF